MGGLVALVGACLTGICGCFLHYFFVNILYHFVCIFLLYGSLGAQGWQEERDGALHILFDFRIELINRDYISLL